MLTTEVAELKGIFVALHFLNKSKRVELCLIILCLLSLLSSVGSKESTQKD